VPVPPDGSPRPVLAHLALALALAGGLLAGCAPRPAPPGAGVAELPEHYTHSIAALGWPGAHRAFQVGPGSVVSTGECALEWLPLPAGDAGAASPVWFERDGVPVAHWTMSGARQTVEFEAAAAPERALGDTGLVLSVRATVTWRDAAPGTAGLVLRVRSAPGGPHVVPWDAPDATAHEEWWLGRAAVRDGRVVALLDPERVLPQGAPTMYRHGRATGDGPGSLRATCEAQLSRGQSRAWEFLVPLYPFAQGPGGSLERVSHAGVVAEARRFWRDRLARAAALETPDTLVNLAWRAALVTLVQCQERDSGLWVPIGSPFQYRDVWLRDGARVVRALAVAGVPDLAADDARTLARFQLPGGALLSQRGQLDGTGEALWAFAQAATLPPAPALARELLPTAREGLSWIRRQRGNTISLRLPWAGLLPFGEPRDGELVRANLVGNDAWALAGCAAVADLATLAGDTALAREAREVRADYGAAFGQALARARHADIPPSWQGPGRDWGNAAVGYPTRALPERDPRLAALARRLRERAAPSGLVCYGPDDSLHTYLGADLAQVSLLAGRPAETQAYLAGLLAHSSSTLGQAEIVSRGGGFGANLPPHATASATLVDLLRNMVVSDTRDTLEVGLGAPLAWWAGTRLERAPTRHGVAGLRLERPAPDVLRLRLDPLAAPLRVRVPDGVRATAALSPGARLAGADGRWVEAGPGTREVSFRVAPEPGR